MVGKKRKEGQSIRSFTPGKYLNLPRFLSNFNFSNGDMIHAENLRKGNQLRRPFDPPFPNSPVVVAKGKRVFQISSRKKFNLAASQRLKASTSEQLLSFSLGH